MKLTFSQEPRRALLWLAVPLAALALHLEGTRSIRRPGLDWDNYRQLAAAQNWIAGRGLTLASYSPMMPGRAIRRTVTQWAPGYAIAIAALQRALGSPLDAVAAVSVLGTIGFVVIWIGWMLALLPELGLGLSAVGLAWGLLGLTPLQWLPAAGRLTWVCFLGCLLFAYRVESGLGRRKVLEISAAVLLGALCAGLRYAYWPILAALAALSMAKWDRRWRSVRIVLCVLGTAVFAWGALHIRQKGPDGALHWMNWSRFFPFPLSAFGASDWLGLDLRSPAALAAAALLALGVSRPKGWDRTWLRLAVVGIVVTTATLAAASLVLAAGKAATVRITPVGEARYFAPAVGVFMLLWLVKAARGALPVVGAALPLAAAALGLGYQLSVWDPGGSLQFAQKKTFCAIRERVLADRAKGKRVFWVQDSESQAANFAVAAGAVQVPDRHKASFLADPPEGAVVYFDRERGAKRRAPPAKFGVWRSEAIEIFRIASPELAEPASSRL